MACIRKRRGRWVIDFYDQYGKRRWQTLPEVKTKGDAKEELRNIEEKVAKGIYLPIRKVPSFSKVAKDWLKYKKPRIRISTWEVHEGHLRNHFSDFEDLKINRMTVATVEKYITERQLDKMNINTLRKVLITLNQILNYAVRHRYIDHNPLRDAERPRERGNEEEGQGKITILTAPQIKTLLHKVKNAKYRTLFTVAIFSGARQGELLGLKWGDIDWHNKQIHVQRTFNNGRFFATKTKCSKRRIDIGPKVQKALKEWKLACPPNDLGLVFPNGKGGPIDHNNLLKRHFYPALKDAGLPRVRFHDLRHTYASLLIEQGENIKYVQSQLGHSSPTVTLNVYAHLMKPTNQEAACRLEDTIFGGDGSKMVAETKKEVLAGAVTP
ncbi:MAG: site-specific integrase [Desulfobacterales bacterium]|nr:MAG: site-specific integrase [Desulfobacterales bacterium]